MKKTKKVDHTINLNLLSTHSNSTSTPMITATTIPSWNGKLCEENYSDLESSDTEFDNFYNKYTMTLNNSTYDFNFF